MSRHTVDGKHDHVSIRFFENVLHFAKQITYIFIKEIYCNFSLFLLYVYFYLDFDTLTLYLFVFLDQLEI